jgi:ABC-type sugar transport system permease subunit
MARTQASTKKQIPARRQASSMRLQQLNRYLFVAPTLAYITLTMIYPVLSNLRMSFYDVNVSTFLSNTAPFIGFGNYSKVIGDPAFQNALQLSVLFTVGSLLFQFVLGFAFATGTTTVGLDAAHSGQRQHLSVDARRQLWDY